jgi:DNA-binding transcriptional LysR family regulator
MRLNQLDGLLAFWKVAEHHGFSAAAAALEVSPSALSQAIRHLEARLGVRLLNRNTRSVSLTEAGQAYLSRIGPALSDVLEAGEQLHERGSCASTQRESRPRWCSSRCWPGS